MQVSHILGLQVYAPGHQGHAARRRHPSVADPRRIPFGPFLVSGAVLAGPIAPAALT